MALFARKSRMLQNDVLDTVIGPSSTWRGTLRSDGGVRVEGRFEGCIEVAGNVVVAESGIVDGDIIARDVVIGGVVRGDVEGAGRLEVLSTGQLIGDITVSSFMIDEGGLFEGISRLQGAASARTMALPAPLEDVPELPDMVIDVDRPKRGRKQRASSEDAADAHGDATPRASRVKAVPAAEAPAETSAEATEEPVNARTNVKTSDVAPTKVEIDESSVSDVEKTAAREKAAVEIIDPEPIAKPKSGRKNAGASSIFDDLDLDIEPVIPDASSKGGSAQRAASSASDAGNASKQSSSKRGMSKSAMRRAANAKKNGARS